MKKKVILKRRETKGVILEGENVSHLSYATAITPWLCCLRDGEGRGMRERRERGGERRGKGRRKERENERDKRGWEEQTKRERGRGKREEIEKGRGRESREG